MNGRPLIAIVDDDAAVCKAIERLLRSCHIDALSYSSARDFLDHGECRNPDCIVLDVQMPGMNGIALRDELKKRQPCSGVVFITAHDDEAIRKEAMEDGCAYLRKPFSDQDLLAAINRTLKKLGLPG